jgi:hypothetical protein
MLKTRALAFGALLAISSFATSRAKADIFASHTPTHAVANADVTLTGEASDGGATVELAYERLKLTVTNGRLSQTVVTPMTVVQTCRPPQPANGCSFRVTGGFPDASLIRFRATATPSSGPAETDEYSFAAGAFPLPRRPIPIRVTGAVGARLNLVLIADVDVSTPLRSQLRIVLIGRHFHHSAIRDNRRLYNFYYSSFTGNYESGCDFTRPANYTELANVADAIMYLHQAPERDCSSGLNTSAEISGDQHLRTLLHEYGHTIFGLADEYSGDSLAKQKLCFTNVWNSKAACQADPISNGLTCVSKKRRDGTFFWTVDGNDVMSGGQVFGRACLRRVGWRYDSCRQGDCFQNCP